ncbi:fibronectin type III domain-containing protein [Candidatus Woesebacteria bacterium]|nr:fibronectin type III domain-containing protein [Candidatus Woesebacteria bacterium]
MKRIISFIKARYQKERSLKRWQWQSVASLVFAAGFTVGTYFAISSFITTLYAADTIASTWEIDVPGEYAVSDSLKIEVANSSARLSVQNYVPDASTKLLLHMDEASGNPADSATPSGTATPTGLNYVSGQLNNAGDFNGTSSQVSMADSSNLSLSGSHSLEAWAKLDNSFSASSHGQKQGILDKGDYRLYYDQSSGKVVYELANSASTTWTQQAGNDIKNSWDLNGKNYVRATVADSSNNVYVGLGNAVSDAEVWKWNGTTWSQIGGDGDNGSWQDQQFENVWSLAVDSTYIYAGLGDTAGDAEVWRCSLSSCTDWDKIGGDAVNSSWALSTYEYVSSLVMHGSVLYAGVGASANDAEVWSWDGATWTKRGGDSINSGWTTNFETVWSMVSNGTYLFATLGDSTTDAEVWRWNGSAWTKVGGDGVSSSWNTNYEQAFSLTLVGTTLYAGIGNTANDGEVWRCNTCTTTPSWSQIGGDSLNSGWTTNYEMIYGLTNDGTNVYAGLGNSDGDGEVWRWNGSAWTKLGGDSVGSGWTTAEGDIVMGLVYNNSTLFAGVSDAGGNTTMWSHNGTSWTRMGGGGVNNSWGFFNLQSVETMTVSNGYLYAGTGVTVAGNALVWRFDGTSWNMVGGNGLNSSWAVNTYESVLSMVHYAGNLYVGLGTSANDAEVWRYNGSTWTQVGGDSLNSGWTTNFEGVYALAADSTYLYAALGNSTTDAEVWRYNGTVWSKIGGDGIGSSWNTSYETAYSLGIYNGNLIAGIGNSTTDAEVWSYNGSTWTKIGGDGVNSSWNTIYEQVNAMIAYNGALVVGIGTGTDDAEVWSYNGSAWTKIGGDDVNSSWTAGTYENVRSLVVYNGDLYAAVGDTAGDGEVWRYSGGSWSQLGGDGLNAGWDPNVIEYVGSFSVYKGKLYAGTGNGANIDAAIWSYGNNGYVETTATTIDTSWHHYAATYDGSTMKIYIDGVEAGSASASVTIPDTARALLVGSTYGAQEAGLAQGYFTGLIDEVRISNTVRGSFQTTPYTAEAQTVRPAAAAFTTGVADFTGFVATESAAGGSISYRLSSDSGSTWQYYSSGWTTSASTSQANTAAEIDTNIGTFPVGSGGIMWQAILDGDGTQQVALTGVVVEAEEDLEDPTNPSSLTSLSASGGSSITTNTWYTHATPYFSWSGATDAGSGVSGYYVYFGTNNTAEPSTAGTLQAGTTYTASSLTSGQTYYLRIATIDVAGNVASAWDAFTYKYDAAGPTNPSALVVAPAGYSQTNDYTFNWTAGSDSASGLAGYQYKTATASGTLSDWSTTTTSTSINLPAAAYQIDTNVFYLRAIDNAGNTSTPMTINYYFAGDGPSEPQFLQATPSTNTTNSFAFSWQAPATFSGDEADLTYCYTVNTLPNADSCTYTSAGATSLSASSFATQVGLNTFYLVAKNPADLGGAIAYSNYTSATFTANTSAPGIPLNIDVADISIKSASNWRLTVSWAVPTDTGSGVSSYKIFRSTDDTTYTEIATTTGTAYVDTGLSQIDYYYKVAACDSVENCGAYTAAVTMLPTGKYTDAAALSSGPTVSGITTKKATISWVTDRESDSRVQYGEGSGDYFNEEPSNSDQLSDHEIELSNLSPGTTYYYRVKWTDEDGNIGVSGEKSFSTSPAPTVKDVTAKKIGLTTATLSLTVTGASKVRILYGVTETFGGVTEQVTSTSESSYDVELSDLLDGTKYYYQVNAYDSEDNVYEGTILFFTTSPRPKISSVKLQQVKGTATSTILLNWVSNTETSTIVTYYPVDNPSLAQDKVDLKLVKNHQMVLRDLLPQTDYVVIAKGRDKGGNEALSEPQKVTTATDTRPPSISNVRVEAVVQGVGEEATAQLVVSWDTDELASSQVLYGEGSSGSLSNKTQKDDSLTFNHLVVVPNLQVSKVYHLKVVTADKANNETQSIDQVVITPKATRSALNLVISNLSQAFGFLGGIQ